MKLVTLVLLALVALATGVAYIAPETEDEVQSAILADMAHFDKSDVQSEIAEDSDDESELALTHADLDALSQHFDQDRTAEVQDPLVKGQRYRHRARIVTRRYRRPRQIIRRVTRRIRPRQRVIIIRRPPLRYFQRMKHLKALLRNCKLRLQKVIALLRHRRRYVLRRRGRG